MRVSSKFVRFVLRMECCDLPSSGDTVASLLHLQPHLGSLLASAQGIIPTFHFQRSLMRLPVPKLGDTLSKYLRWAEPLIIAQQAQGGSRAGAAATAAAAAAATEQIQRTRALVRAWGAAGGPGEAAQAALVADDRAHAANSYISDMWFQQYLRSRAPLPLLYNPSLTWRNHPHPEANEQITKAANLAHIAARFYCTLQDGSLEPDVFHTKPQLSRAPLFQKAVAALPERLASYPMYAASAYPLDMSQFKRLFASTRIPKQGCDELVSYHHRVWQRQGQGKGQKQQQEPVRHMLVLRGKQQYAVPLLQPAAGGSVDQLEVVPVQVIESCLRGIVADAEAEAAATPKAATDQGNSSRHSVTLLTAADRDSWAAARQQLLTSPQNAACVDAADSALFALTLEHAEGTDWARESQLMLAGNCENRHFDKCMNLVVTANGRAGLSWEHAWGDGAAVLYFFNAVHAELLSTPLSLASGKQQPPARVARLQVSGGNRRDDTDTVRAGQSVPVVRSVAEGGAACLPVRLEWHVPPGSAVADALACAADDTSRMLNALQLQVYQSSALNKGDIKASGLSPDGVMQMALQIAHWRAHPTDRWRLPCVYESASTAAFKAGRTERIASASMESFAMCKAFDSLLETSSSGSSGSSSTKRKHSKMSSELAEALFTALRRATEEHKATTLQCVMGKGCDRHLFALQRWAEKLGLSTPLFADPTYTRYKDIRLSTSTLQSEALDAGSFGPGGGTMYALGYGVADRGVHVSAATFEPGYGAALDSKLAAGSPPPPHTRDGPTDCNAYVKELEGALQDIHQVIRAVKGGHTTTKK